MLAVIGIVAFVQRQHRRESKWNRPRSIFSSSSDSIQAGPGMVVTPFDQNFPEATHTGITTEQRPFITGEPGAEAVSLRYLSSSTPAPVAAGLSDRKGLARLRAEAPTSHPSNPQNSTSNVSLSTFSPTAVAETGGAALSSDTRILYSEVESLRREMERLRAEGLVAAPPSYTEGSG
jgi:hypothetical protein